MHIQSVKNVPNYVYGKNSIAHLQEVLKNIEEPKKYFFFIIDIFFKNKNLFQKINIKKNHIIYFFDSKNEPSTDDINNIVKNLKKNKIKAVIGIGGGSVMDVAKAVSNMLTNKGNAEDFQGWDLLKRKGVFKIGIPTISGTGAESTRTCVLINKKNKIKLGMNSDYSIFDLIILDPSLSITVPRNKFFFTGMDTYIHCMESLSGFFRNPIADSFSREALNLCRRTFNSKNMKSEESRKNIMIASYLGGAAIAMTYVGLVHPISAALGTMFEIHHCVGNCMVMRGMKEFYPKYYNEFWKMASMQKINVPKGNFSNLTQKEYDKCYELTIIHSKPLVNALGKNYTRILTKKKFIEILKKI